MDWLHHSEKNRAENVMIVDMIRNDLGRIAQIGSVQVPRLFEVERYPTVLQMTSTVTAQTTASFTQIMLTALFPCASITGAPKVSTMKIIADLETTPRGVYTGAIGYLTPDRSAQFNVAIRTVTIDREAGQAEYGVGGGIVWDSDAADEYRECEIKTRVLTSQPIEFESARSVVVDTDGRLLPARSTCGAPDGFGRLFWFSVRSGRVDRSVGGSAPDFAAGRSQSARGAGSIG